MIYNTSIVYFELQKTGCTHTRDYLLHKTDEKFIELGKHNGFNQLPEEIKSEFDKYLKVGNIRNPWDWYVSLWAYGCLNKGGLKSRLKNNARNWKPWQTVYKDSEDKESFNKWLHYLLINKRTDVVEYRKFQDNPIIGLLTYRYFKLYTKSFQKESNTNFSKDDISNYADCNFFIDIILKNESLDSSIASLSQKLKLKTKENRQESNKRTNTSKRKPYTYYYNEKSKKLVEKMEWYLIDKYGYEF